MEINSSTFFELKSHHVKHLAILVADFPARIVSGYKYQRLVVVKG